MIDHEDHGEGIVGPRPETASGGPVPSPTKFLDMLCPWCDLGVQPCTCPLPEYQTEGTTDG